MLSSRDNKLAGGKQHIFLLGKKTKAMNILRWILSFYFLFMLTTSVFARDPESILTDYFDKVLDRENSSAYSLISDEDKK